MRLRQIEKTTVLISFLIIVYLFMGCNQNKYRNERQLTNDFSQNHDLDNNDNFSPDDQWLVYDTREEKGGIGANGTIEKVNVITGESVVLYQLKNNKTYGPGVGAASYSHIENKVVFIHGLFNANAENPYQQWKRTGVIVQDSAPDVPIFMDARDVTLPFTPGSLRGGTHRHEWSRDGDWIGFTYNDALMKKLEDATGTQYNLRTIGVSKKGIKVVVKDALENEDFSGNWFSVLVVKVVTNPKRGSDEIKRAESDSWVGTNGYSKDDGSKQRARAFIGTVLDSNGNENKEVFVVDIPDCISCVGPDGPLEGTTTSFPARPAGTVQRRLTFTSQLKYPGCEGVVRSSYDGELLAYLAYDGNGVKQVFTISPKGGKPKQQTFHKSDVQSGVRWHPATYRICYVWNNAVVSRTIGNTEYEIYTKPSHETPLNLVWCHDGSKIAYNRIVANKEGKSAKQIFVIDF